MGEEKTEERQIDGIEFSDRNYERCVSENTKNAKLQPKTAHASQTYYELFRRKTIRKLTTLETDRNVSQQSLDNLKEIDNEVINKEKEATIETIERLEKKYQAVFQEEMRYVRTLYHKDVDFSRPLKTGEKLLLKIKGLCRKIRWVFSSYQRFQDSLDISNFTNSKTAEFLKQSFQKNQENIVSDIKDIVENNFEVQSKKESNSVNDKSLSVIVDYPQQQDDILEKNNQQTVQNINDNNISNPEGITQNDVIYLSGPVLESLPQDSIGNIEDGNHVVVPVADLTDNINKNNEDTNKNSLNFEGNNATIDLLRQIKDTMTSSTEDRNQLMRTLEEMKKSDEEVSRKMEEVDKSVETKEKERIKNNAILQQSLNNLNEVAQGMQQENASIAKSIENMKVDLRNHQSLLNEKIARSNEISKENEGILSTIQEVNQMLSSFDNMKLSSKQNVFSTSIESSGIPKTLKSASNEKSLDEMLAERQHAAEKQENNEVKKGKK